jgi:hypothetical protein
MPSTRAVRRLSTRDTVPDARRRSDPRREAPTQPAMPRVEPSPPAERRSPSGVRGRKARGAVLEVDATSHARDPRREDDDDA